LLDVDKYSLDHAGPYKVCDYGMDLPKINLFVLDFDRMRIRFRCRDCHQWNDMTVDGPRGKLETEMQDN